MTTIPSTPSPDRRHVASGLAYGIAAYVWWGFLIPTLFAILRGVSPWELLAHRVVFGLPFIALLLWALGLWGEFRQAIVRWSSLRVLLVTSALITLNWFTFVYAVVEARLLESSLGYFINPLVSVVLGMVFLGERLRPLQWVSFAIASAAVAYRAVTALAGDYPHVPWIPAAVAISFAFYGLLRKKAHAGSTVGLAVEVAVLFPFMLALLVWLGLDGSLTIATALGGDADAPWRPLAALGSDATLGAWGGWPQTLVLASAGAITVLPLIWFAVAARRLRLSTLGLLQYIAPMGQFVIAVIFGERWTTEWAITFGGIWAALALYTFDSLRAHRRAAPAETAGADSRDDRMERELAPHTSPVLNAEADG